MAADAAVSLGVALAGVAILYTGYHWLDPLISLVVSVVIVLGTWGLLRASISLVLHGVPEGVDMDEVHNYLATLPGVTAVHDLHVWGLSTTEAALTAHLVIPSGYPGDDFLAQVAKELHDRFHIEHSTIQAGSTESPCSLSAQGT